MERIALTTGDGQWFNADKAQKFADHQNGTATTMYLSQQDNTITTVFTELLLVVRCLIVGLNGKKPQKHTSKSATQKQPSGS